MSSTAEALGEASVMDAETRARGVPFLCRDRRVALTVGAIGLAFLAGTFTFDAVPAALMEGLGASEFPRLIGAVIVLLAVLLFLKPVPASEEPLPRVDGCGWATLLSCLGFLAVMELAGMLVAMLVFMVAVGWLWGERRIPVLLASAVPMVACVWFVFIHVFGITLPHGVLGEALFH